MELRYICHSCHAELSEDPPKKKPITTKHLNRSNTYNERIKDGMNKTPKNISNKDILAEARSDCEEDD